MRNDLLHVIAVYSNPIRWKSRHKVHAQFEEEMLEAGVNLTTVECAFGDRPWDLSENKFVNRVQVRHHGHNLIWNKENCQNIGLMHLPGDAKYIMMSDADIHFRKKHWASEVVHALQHYHVIQPWEHCYDLGPHDEHLQAHDSFCKLWWHGEPTCKEGPNWWTWEGGDYRYAHTGFAWAYTRQALEWLGGLIETAALGAGDHHMAHCLVGKAHLSLPGFVSEGYSRPIMQWQDRAMRHINFNIGYIPGSIEHHFHGRKEDRKYVDRWQIIKDHQFDPYADTKRNIHGLIELAGNKPMLAHDIDRYFRQRNEDMNCL